MDQIAQPLGIAATIAHHHFFRRCEHARGVTENQGSIGRGQTISHLPRAFQQFGGNQQIELSW